jgi:hypothetical protein
MVVENDATRLTAGMAGASPPVERRDKNSFRYDYFNIWSSGLKFRDEIINMIRSEEKFEIVEMFDYRPPDLGEFVADLYIYDSIPKGHIHRKIGRITAEGPEMVILFVKHYDPDLVSAPSMYLEGVINWKSRFVSEFKTNIRKRFVPGDNMWAIDIFHGSDYEEQVDHLLKMLDRVDGIQYLYSRYGKPDPVPGTFGNSNFVAPRADV